MIQTINGHHYHNLIDYGLRNLARHSSAINAMNVFPVPDGDTGTNMIQTLQNGFAAIAGCAGKLSDLCRKFADAVVFGARGSSGVILSQFFKGFSESFYGKEDATCEDVVHALEKGVSCAYRAVLNPVEGTVLTVLREATAHTKAEVMERKRVHTINGVFNVFLQQAKTALEQTPEQLPVLKEAGVVDSGGAGLVYVFEGMDKYLNNETLDPVQTGAPAPQIDYSQFNRQSQFLYGYCTELLVQLTEELSPEEEAAIQRQMTDLGDEVMTVFSEDKVKIHVHTDRPEQVMAYCHQFGEFLALKIENMSVQNAMLQSPGIFSNGDVQGDVAVIAVAFDTAMKDRFLQMGADVVIQARRDLLPSTQDFVEAFQTAKVSELVLFPNSGKVLPAAQQAIELSPSVRVTIVETESVAACYAALPMVDFGALDGASAIAETQQILQNMQVITVRQAVKNSVLDGIPVRTGDFLAFDGKTLLAAEPELFVLVGRISEILAARKEWDTITIFGGRNIEENQLEATAEYLKKRFLYVETDIVSTQYDSFELLLSFE